MVIKTFKIFSYCNDFTEEEQEVLQQDRVYDSFITYQANSKKWLEQNNYDIDPVAIKLIELGAEENEEVLIHLDW